MSPGDQTSRNAANRMSHWHLEPHGRWERCCEIPAEGLNGSAAGSPEIEWLRAWRERYCETRAACLSEFVVLERPLCHARLRSAANHSQLVPIAAPEFVPPTSGRRESRTERDCELPPPYLPVAALRRAVASGSIGCGSRHGSSRQFQRLSKG